VFTPGGFFPPGTAAVEKRGIAARVPAWNSANCTQCNICSFICPHAAIRPALATPEELAAAPPTFGTVPVRGGGAALKGFQYRVQVGEGWRGCVLSAEGRGTKAVVTLRANLHELLATLSLLPALSTYHAACNLCPR
jgi:ferredoxin